MTGRIEPTLPYENAKSGIHLLDKADDHLHAIQDSELLILKVHLLIEEALTEKISSFMKNPKYFHKSNLRFYQMMQIARALFDNSSESGKDKNDNDLFWNAIDALNTLRNRLAHRLENDDTEALLRRFLLISPYDGQSLNEFEVRIFIGQSYGYLIGKISSLERAAGESNK